MTPLPPRTPTPDRQYDTRDGNCDLCGGDPAVLGPCLTIVHFDQLIHAAEPREAGDCTTDGFLICPWCLPHRRRFTRAPDSFKVERRFDCPECFPVDPVWRAELILRREGGETPWCSDDEYRRD